jgi:putative heme-binding domain-containing protein
LTERWSNTLTEARRVIAQSDADLPARIAAARFLGAGGTADGKSNEDLSKLLVPQSPDALQKTIVAVLAETGREDVPKQLFKNWRSHSPGLRAAILDALLEQKRLQSSVLDALESETISVVDVDTVRRERLLNLGTKPQQARAAKLFKSATASSRGQVVQQFAEVLETSGDIGRGRLVFEKRCATCHKLDGIGKSIGADLGSLKDRSGQAMLTAILDPNLAVEAKFLSFTAATLSGQTYAGMLLTETGTSITLIGADGKEHILPRAELELLSGSNRSFMPEGFEKDLTVQDLADVIRFIQSSTEPPKPTE